MAKKIDNTADRPSNHGRKRTPSESLATARGPLKSAMAKAEKPSAKSHGGRASRCH
jgi:hypothetical protein